MWVGEELKRIWWGLFYKMFSIIMSLYGDGEKKNKYLLHFTIYSQIIHFILHWNLMSH